MDYIKNLLDIVPVSNDTPSKLSALQSSIISRANHDIPFFLMPVRMETRFMKPLRSTLSEVYTVDVLSVLEGLGTISTLIGRVSAYEGFTSLSVHKAALEIKDLFVATESQAQAISTLQAIERADLNRAISAIDNSLSGAMNHLVASTNDQAIISEIQNTITPSILNLKSSIASTVSNASIDSSWQQNTSTLGVALSGTINATISSCNSLLTNLGSGQNFSVTTFNALKIELNALVNELNNDSSEYNLQDKQLVWVTMEPMQVVLNSLNNAVNTAQANPQVQADLHWLNKRLAKAWHNFGQNDSATIEWIPTPENSNRSLSEEEVAQFPQSITALKANIESLLSANATTLSLLDNAQGAPDILLLNSILTNLSQIKNLLSGLSEPLKELETLFLWEKMSAIDAHLVHTESIIGILSATDASSASSITDTLSLTSHSLTEEWTAKTGVSTAIDVVNVFSFYVPVNELWIRVYPDDIFIHNHEEALTEKEKEAGTEFWKEWWAARGDKAKELAAWRALIALYGITRAAWIVKALTPTTISTTGTATKATGAIAKIGVLSTYTTKITSVVSGTSSGIIKSIPHFLSHYTPHLEYLTSVIAEITEMPSSLVSIASEEILSVKKSFEKLSEILIDKDSHFADAISAIDEKITLLSDRIDSVDQISSWDVNYDANPTFPQVEIKAGSWTAAAYTSELPDSFVFATIRDNSDSSYNFNHIKVGNPVPLTLQVGIHPDSSVFDLDAFENLKLDPELKWMFDFEEAVRIGMGITIRLTDDEAKNGFDKVLALGVKLGVSADISATDAHNYGKDLIEKLFKNHHFSGDGMSVLTLGTPTNNTDNDNAGFRKPDSDGSLSFATELAAPLYSRSLDKLKRRDGQWIADALGIEYDTFYHIENAHKRQISGAIAMNRALWPGTIGNFMSEMMNPLFTKDNIERTKNYFSDYVLGRNTVPSIRIGSQPYGIFPTTAYTRWKFPIGAAQTIPTPIEAEGIYVATSFSDFYKGKAGFDTERFFQERFNQRFFSVLKILNNTWLNIVNSHVKTADKKSSNVQSDFMELLGTDALMAEVYSRFMVNSSKFKTVIDNYNTTLTDSKWNTADVKVPNELFGLLKDLKLNDGLSVLGLETPIFDDFLLQNLMIADGKTRDEMAAILNNSISAFNIDLIKENPSSGSILSRGEYLLKGPSVDEKVLSDIDLLTPIAGKNYVEWLLSAAPKDVWKNNAFGNMQSRSLLFLLLRQSLLSVYRDTAMNTLVSLKEFSQSAVSAIGHSRGIAGQILKHPNQLILTKWHLLFKSKNYLLDNSKGLDLAYQYFSENPKVSYPDPSWWYHNSARPGLTSVPSFNDVPVADFLFNKTEFSSRADYGTMLSNTNWESIENVKKGFEHIKDLPTADLDMLLREHIDLASYRLDAWNAGMVNKRLWDNRNTEHVFRKKGLYVGAYGWLLDVKPKEKPMVKIDASAVPSHLKDSSDTLYYDQTNLGFLHTPSISHALTAAILRSGYISERNTDDNKFAINLSSERVQMAMSLLEGMRNGQTLNALLGYMFERGLHENYPDILPLDEHIYKYRKVFPLEGSIAPTSIDDKQTPNQVVDGIELLNEFRNSPILNSFLKSFPDKSIIEIYLANISTLSTIVFFGNLEMPLNLVERLAIITEFDRIANAIDALADLAIAEGVFQIAKGNAARSAATMEAFTEGKNPPIPEIVNTPTTGTNLAHKLVNLITPLSGTISSPWTGVDLSPKAKSEPSINQWAADILYASFDATLVGSPSLLPEKIGCLVSFKDEDDLTVAIEVTLKDLNIQPIDILYMVRESNYSDELTQRIKAYTRKNATNYSSTFTGIPSTVSLKVQLNEKGTRLISIWEIHCLLNSVAHLVTQSRYLKAEDFLHNANPVKHTGTAPAFFNTAEMIGRAENLYNSFDTDIRTYFQALTESTKPTNIAEINILRNKLQLAAQYGIDFAIPDSQIEDFSGALVQELFELGDRVKSEILTRFATATIKKTILIPSSTSTEAEKINASLDIMSALLGASFKAIPHCSFDYYAGLEVAVKAQIAASSSSGTGIMRHHNATPSKLEACIEDWIYGLARVQDKVEHIETLRMLTEDASTKPLHKMLPVQFPYIATSTTTTEDYWLGASYPETFEPQGDKFSIAIFDYEPLLSTSTTYPFYAGMVFAEWDEAIPEKEVTTGISFNYDQPNAKAPQNVLLGVHPRNEGTWTLDDLWFTLLDTLEMAKIRMVEPDHFKKKGTDTTTNKFEIFKWVLPAIVGEVTPHDTNIVDGKINHVRYQGDDSVQQVSFEYNPNNDKIPSDYLDPTKSPGDTTSSSSFLVKDGADWDKLDADTIMSDDALSEFMLLQDQLTEIAQTQQEMKQMQEQEEIINNPQQ